MHAPLRSLGVLVLVLAAADAAGCGGSSDGSPPGDSAGGAVAGASGAGGTSSPAGAAGSGVAGKAGSGGGSAGKGAGQGGSAGKGAGGSGGAGGSAGPGGSAGAGGGGSSGAGGSSGCTKDADCVLPPTIPPSCAQATCDVATKICSFSAKDADGDKHISSKCKSTDGTPILVGDDCDDTDATTFAGAWDGPVGDGHPNRCDGLDQDCDGIPDDTKLKNGTTCTCTPGDVQSCSEDTSGKPIAWPIGKPTGECKYGSKTCLANGTFGPCAGAIVPADEVCNAKDDDCNGIKDDGPPPDNVPTDANYYAYDGDNDQHGLVIGNGYNLVHACAAPVAPPVTCTLGSFAGCSLGTTAAECCPANAWKFAKALQSDDCNDENPKVNPLAPEACDMIDDNCDGVVDETCVCQPNAVDAACATTSNGNPIVFPGGSPQGACHYGSRTCSSDGKSWGPCLDAASPAATDDCITPGGVDTTCDGTISCACSPLGNVQPCANQLGSCAGATQTCGASGYGACTVIPAAGDTCDAGNDASCNGKPNEGCAHVNGDPCGDASTCNVGIWTSCDNTGVCVCSGGAPLAPVVWCYDGDGDFYCDLTMTQAVCANATTQPATPWRPLSTAACTDPMLCTDCNDASATIHPNAPEACNGVDSNCSGTVNDGCNCQNGTVVNCGSAAQCNQGATKTCQNGAFGPCSVAPVLNAGADCGGNGNGACSAVNSAQMICSSPSSGVASCTNKNGVGATAVFNTTPYPGLSNPAEWDYNCDGNAAIEYTNTNSHIEYVIPPNCLSVNAYNAACGKAGVIPNGLPCYNGDFFVECLLSQFGSCTFDQSCAAPSCGSNMTRVFCTVSGGTCVYDSTKAPVAVKQPCK